MKKACLGANCNLGINEIRTPPGHKYILKIFEKERMSERISKFYIASSKTSHAYTKTFKNKSAKKYYLIEILICTKTIYKRLETEKSNLSYRCWTTSGRHRHQVNSPVRPAFQSTVFVFYWRRLRPSQTPRTQALRFIEFL